MNGHETLCLQQIHKQKGQGFAPKALSFCLLSFFFFFLMMILRAQHVLSKTSSEKKLTAGVCCK